MNLSKLFEMQSKLDEKIIAEKNLGDMDRLPYLILALQVELGECANEWRGFKFWSKDMEPRVKTRCMECHGYGYKHNKESTCLKCKGSGSDSNPLLEEYVDCLHFILSIGLTLGFANKLQQENIQEDIEDTLESFQHVFNWAVNLEFITNKRNNSKMSPKKCYENLIDAFRALGYHLGFTWDQIEQAYMDKNAVNHERQLNGY